MFEIFIFLLGLCFGSFLNVCIHRLPREQSIVVPASQCPQCKHSIAWYDNIPLVSFIILKAKCRHCAAPISIRYFLIELATGFLWLSLFMEFGWTAAFVAGVILISILLAVSVIDLETGLIPDRLTFPGMAAGVVAAGIAPGLLNQNVWYLGILYSALGLVIGGGILWLTAVLAKLVFRKESMGGGDIKLLAMIGAFVGAGKTVMVFFLAPFAALPFALYMKYVRKSETIPYGPYLAISGAVVFCFGDTLLSFLGW